MSALPFLLLAFGTSLLGGGVMWWWNRRPVSIQRDVAGFAREMAALSPDPRRDRAGPPVDGSAVLRPDRRR